MFWPSFLVLLCLLCGWNLRSLAFLIGYFVEGRCLDGVARQVEEHLLVLLGLFPFRRILAGLGVVADRLLHIRLPSCSIAVLLHVRRTHLLCRLQLTRGNILPTGRLHLLLDLHARSTLVLLWLLGKRYWRCGSDLVELLVNQIWSCNHSSKVRWLLPRW